jgi:hypothetical protein
VAGAVALVALAVLVGASFLPEGAIRSVLENLAAVVFAIGVIEVLFEAYLQTRLSSELIERVDTAVGRVETKVELQLQHLATALSLDRSLGPTGLETLSRTPVDWTDFLSGSSRIQLVPWELDSWQQQEWAGALEAARTDQLQLDLYLPNPETNGLGAFEQRLGLDESDFQSRARRAIEDARAGWQEVRHTPGSVLNIYTYDLPVGMGIVLANGRWALTAAPIQGPRPGTSALVALARDGSDAGYREWIEGQIRVLGAQLFDQVAER